MWKAIIIDDEKLIRMGLMDYIDWAALEVKVCDTCANGTEGLESILKWCPDIVITDISMPYMDGVSLLKQSRLHGLSCEFIFISAYSDFAYAKDAVTYGAFDYLLKPLEAPILFDCVRRCVQKLSATLRPALPQLDQDALGEIIHNMLTCLPRSEPAFHALLKYHGISGTSSLYLATFVNGSPAPVHAWLEENRPMDFRAFPAEISRSVQVLLLYLPGMQESFCCQFKDYLNQHQAVYEFLPCGEGICAAFERSMLALLERSRPSPAGMEPFAYLSSDRLALSDQVIKSLAPEQLDDAMSVLIKQFSDAPPSGHEKMMEQCARFLENVYRQLEECYGTPLQGCPEKGTYVRRLRGANNFYDAFLLLQQLMLELFAHLRSQATGSPYTKEALAIIRSRYGEDLSLKQVAKEIRVSGSHLSMVFKTDTGHSFSEYLFLHRMQIAQELILHGKHKIYEVGAKVGYPDVVQFSKRFKDHFHYSPKQWQKSTLLGDSSLTKRDKK